MLVASKIIDARDLAQMAMVCRAWWDACRSAAGYNLGLHVLVRGNFTNIKYGDLKI